MGKIAVVGSINMDVVNRVERHPLPGETVSGLETAYIPGGKGANQAVAAARAGAQVLMIGAVGQDPFGGPLVEALGKAGVNTAGVLEKEGTSGMAFITVDAHGENNIILSPGANGRLSAEDMEAGLIGAAGGSGGAGLGGVLLQNEIPWETTAAAVRRARTYGAAVYLNPAPARKVEDEVLALVDVLVVNETEAAAISGLEVASREHAEAAAEWLLGRGVGEVIVTLGAAGVVYASKEGERISAPAFRVEAVDTTAAGDTFIGAYAAARDRGASVQEALRWANAAAAIAVTRPGAQSSIPSADEVNRWLENRG
ncbi:ribokinase [Paenibacillus mesotrionivorans]|uniref:Ribokinase n=1 Tax=Paenibacillus mesotrionivorans TaxID=3160968 RepID=A0ACC7NX22_9BACL